MTRASLGRLLLLTSFLFLPVAVHAQGNGGIAGVAKDTTGAVLPGVTVEAASPVLIEKVRSVTTDEKGQYKIVDLRPGIYTVTFALPGFSTVKREGVELTTGFTATVNGDLRVGAIEETVTVTSASPIVDTQNTRTQTVLTRAVIDVLPTGQSLQAFGALTLGAVTSGKTIQDVGGLDGESSTNISVHGGRAGDMKLQIDGMGFNWSSIGGGGGAARSIFPNQAAIQEVVMEITGMNAEAETGGVQLNLVPKDGSNIVKGAAFTAYSGPSLQSNNLTDELRARGLSAASSVKRVYDNGGGFGGPIKKDKLWFFTAHRKWGAEQYVPGNYFNATPHTLFYTPDLTNQARTWQPTRDHSLRLTGQATEKNKITASVEWTRNCTCFNGIQNSPTAPEATNFSNQEAVLQQSTWSYPRTNKLLFQAGQTVSLNYRTSNRIDGVLRTDIPVIEQSTGYAYGAKAPGAAGISIADYGHYTMHQNNARVSVSYITGTHAFKVGFYILNGDNTSAQDLNDPPVAYTFRNQVPVSIAYFASPGFDEEKLRNMALYAQDQWTLRNLTLNLGVRYSLIQEWIPPQVRPAGPFVGEFRFDEIRNVPSWQDVVPRLGAAYDVFGNGKTAIKVALGQYLEGDGNQTASANNPALSMVTTATRTWSDANHDYIPQSSELGPLSNSAFGTVQIRSGWDPALLQGWGLRINSWQGSAVLQHELRPGMGLTAGYYRTWYNNFRVTDNLLVTPANYDPFCVTAPVDSRLPNGGGNQICGLYNIKPTSFGQVNNLVKAASNFGEPSEVFNGVEAAINSRFGRGGILSGGVSTGQTVTNNCFVIDTPDQRFCKTTMPFKGQTQVKFSGAYPLPWNFQLSGVLQNLPGSPIQATYNATNAQVAPTLGRNLGACSVTAVTCTASVAVTLIEPNTMFEDRLTQLDLRLTRTFRIQRVRIQPAFDVYNAFNGNTVLASTPTYGTAWLQPTIVLAPRLFKFSAKVDF